MMDVRALWGQHSGKNQRQNKSDVYLLEVSLKSRIKKIARFLFFRQVFHCDIFFWIFWREHILAGKFTEATFFQMSVCNSLQEKKKK